MMLRTTLAAIFATAVLATATEAAPLAAGHQTLAAAAPHASALERVALRSCFWRYGRKHCRLVDGPRRRGYAGNGSGYYEQDASRLPVGSSRWWYVKDREGSTGRP